jgi:hypothetical protein
VNTRAAAAAFALILTACPGSPETATPPEIDLSRARQYESEGRTVDALLELARIVEELTESPRDDGRAHVAWARILGALRRLKVHEALASAPDDLKARLCPLEGWSPALLSAAAASHWTKALAEGVEPPILAEGAGVLSDLLAEKADDRTLRRGRLKPEDDVSEALYRCALLRSASDCARYAALRAARTPESSARAVKLLRRLADEIRALAQRPGVIPEFAARWEELASRATAAAVELRNDRAGAMPLSNELRTAVEADPPALLSRATEDVNKANDMLSRRVDEGEILNLLERAIRNFVTARECLVEPSAIQKRTFDVMPIAADALRSLAFAN